MVLGVQLFLLAVPAWEILLHRTCMAQNTGRVQQAVARVALKRMKEKNRGDFVRLASDIRDKKCARCFQPLQHGHTIDAVYEDGDCITGVVLRKAKRQFAEVQKQSHPA